MSLPLQLDRGVLLAWFTKYATVFLLEATNTLSTGSF